MDLKTKPKAEGSERRGATVEQLCQLWGCDRRQVARLAERGIAMRIGRGRFDAPVSTKKYIAHLREQAAGRVGVTGKDAVAANVAFKESQTRLNDQRFKKEAGELIPVEEVRTTWAAIMRTVRQFVLTLPNQIAFEVPTLTVHDRKAIDRLVREGLSDAAMARGFTITPADEAQSLPGDLSNDRT
jgi:terminase small subunit / prophage DNA-packing protein